MPIWLDVPYAQKDKVKALGARWSSAQRRWYVPEAMLLTTFEPWLPKHDRTSRPSSDFLTSAAPRTKSVAKTKPQAELFGQTDMIIGKTITGPGYFDTGHNCIPWIHCEYCNDLMSQHANVTNRKPHFKESN